MAENRDVKLVLELMKIERRGAFQAIEDVKLIRKEFPTQSLFSRLLGIFRKPQQLQQHRCCECLDKQGL